jgi:hypothetical protein
MLSRAFERAANIENTGEGSIESGNQNLEAFCDFIVDDFANAGEGILPGDKLEDFKKDLKLVKTLYSKNQKKMSKNKYETAIQTLSTEGIDPEQIDVDELVTIKELYEAMIATYDYLEFLDPAIERGKEEQDHSYLNEKAEKGAKANIAFGDFFIKMHQRFDLDDEAMDSLYKRIFGNYELRRDFGSKAADHFPTGVYAFLHAYLYLNRSKDENGKFTVPTVDEDRKHSIDLK